MGVLSPEDRMASSRRAFAQKSPHADEPKQHIVRALSQATSQLHIVPPKRRMDAASVIPTPPRPKEYPFTRHTYIWKGDTVTCYVKRAILQTRSICRRLTIWFISLTIYIVYCARYSLYIKVNGHNTYWMYYLIKYNCWRLIHHLLSIPKRKK
jgi:hypothetical protein